MSKDNNHHFPKQHLSQDSSYMTGQVLHLNGGESVGG